MNKKKDKGLFRFVPLWSLPFFAVGLAAFFIERAAKSSIALSDAINATSGCVIRAVLATLTGWFPFSLAETLLLLSPVLVGLLIYIMIRISRNGLSRVIRFTAGILSVGTLVYGLFVFGYGTGYYGTSLDEKMGLDKEKVSAEELYTTGLILANNAKEELDSILFDANGASVMDYSYATMNKKLVKAYKTVSEKYPFFQKLWVGTKPVVLSEQMTYTHLSGVYCFFTGESNVNTNYPDFIMVTSAAHEMAHQRGIAREDEANFASFLVCTNSDDAYLRYSGYIDVLISVMNSLASADSALYGSLVAQIPSEILEEYNAYSAFFDKYRENKAAEVTETVNNTYIESHGQEEGTKSYGLVVDLVVAYYKEMQ